MKLKILVILLFTFYSCSNTDYLTVNKILDGNRIELSNGVVVTLANVEPLSENIKILERYLRGDILLYDSKNDLINDFSSENISAFVYNSDGDCVNTIIGDVTKIAPEEKLIKKEIKPNSGTTIVKMESENGVFTVPVEINGVSLFFIFDTGASLISISLKEAKYLYNSGKISDKDFIGKSKFTDANGDISEGTIINLTEVKIGDKVLNNVQACIIHSQNAPLLLGQSALQKFGRVSIDYNKAEITFE